MAGFDYYLVKPCDPKVLFALVEKAQKQDHFDRSASVIGFPTKR